MRFSVVLPCYNEEANIEQTVRDVAGWFARASVQGDIIAVDDGSRDKTGAVLDRLSREIPFVRVIHHEKNQGYGVAIRTGCDCATGDVIGFMDSDGQFHAKDFAALLPFVSEYAFVTGRRIRRADPLIRRIFGKMLAAMNLLVLGLWVRDINCGMKLFRRSIWLDIRPVHGVEKLFNTEMFLRLKECGIPWHQVRVPHYPRRAGSQTGGSPRVILRMFRELFALKKATRKRFAE